MRRILVASVFVALSLGLIPTVTAPVANAAQGTPCAVNSEDEIRALVTDFNNAYNAQDAQGMAALVAEDLVRHSPRGDTQGADAMAEAFEAFFDIFPDTTTTANLVLVDAPLVVVHVTSTGTQAVPFRETEPTGELATWDGILLLEIACGKIDQMWSRADQLAQINQAAPALTSPEASTEVGTPASCPELTDAAAQTLMDTWFGKVWAGDYDQLSIITTPDVFHHWAVGPDTIGQADQLAHLQDAVGAISGVTTSYDALVVDGEYIAVHWVQTLGDDSWDGLNIFRTECGLIDEVWSELDLAALPPPPADATPQT
jgi:uncharacterized protein (TIGR02246 family)